MKISCRRDHTGKVFRPSRWINNEKTYGVHKHVTLKLGVIKELLPTAVMRTLEL